MSEPKGKEEEEAVDDHVIEATLDMAPTRYAEEVYGPQDGAAFAVPSQTRHLYKPETVKEEQTFKVPEQPRPSKLRELMPLIIAFFIGAAGYLLIRFVF